MIVAVHFDINIVTIITIYTRSSRRFGINGILLGMNIRIISTTRSAVLTHMTVSAMRMNGVFVPDYIIASNRTITFTRVAVIVISVSLMMAMTRYDY